MAGRRNLGSLFVTLELAQDKFQKAIRDAQKDFRKFGRKMDRLGSDLTQKVSLPLTAIGGASTVMATKLNEGMANVGSLIPGNTARVEELRSSIQGLSVDSGKSTGDLTDGLYNVISAFGDTENTMASLELASQASVAGLSTTAEALDLISASTLAYGDTSIEAQRKVANLAFTTVKLGKTTFPELASAMGQVLPEAKQLGLAQEELFAAMAATAGITGSTSQASTQLKAALQALRNPTGELQKLYEKLEVSSGEALIQQYGLQGAFQKITEEADKSGVQLQKFIGSAEGQAQALVLTGSLSDRYTESLKGMNSSSTALSDALKEQTEGVNSFGFAFTQARRRIEVALEKVGQVILDSVGGEGASALKSISEGVLSLADRFAGLEPETQKFIVAFAGLAAVAGPVLTVIGGIAATLGTVMLGSVLAVTAAVAAGGAAWWVWGDDIKGAVDGALNTLDIYWEATKEVFGGGILETWIGLVQDTWDYFEDITIGSVRRAYDEIVGLGRAFVELKETAIREIKSLFDYLPDLSSFSNSLPGVGPAVTIFSGISTAIDEWKGKVDELETEQREHNAALEINKGLVSELDTIYGSFEVQLIGVNREIANQERTFSELLTVYQSFDGILGVFPKKIDKVSDSLGGGRKGGLSDAAKKAKKALEDLESQLEQTERAAKTNEINQAIQDSITLNSSAALIFWYEQLREHTYQGILDGFEKQGGVLNDKARNLGRRIVDGMVDPQEDQSYQDMLDKRAELERKQAEEYANLWSGLMEDAISGTRLNWRDQMQKAGVEIASSFLAEFKDISQNLKEIFKDVGNNLKTGLMDFFSNPQSFADISAFVGGSILAPLVVKESIEGAQSVLEGGDLTFEQQTALALPTFGFSYAYNPIKDLVTGDLFGSDGDADAGGRKNIENWLEEQLGGTNVVFGDRGRFEDEWASTFEAIAGDGQLAFETLGTAIAAFAGQSTELGGQIGFILAENLSGNLDYARLLTQSLGISTQDLENFLLDLGRSGEESWSKVIAMMQTADDLTGEGLVGVGDLIGAYELLQQSGGRGVQALQGVKNIAIEAGEAGVTTLDELREHLLATGQVTVEEIDQLMGALQGAGVTSLEELMNASDVTLGTVVAGLENVGFEFDEFNYKVEEAVDKFSELEEKLIGLENREIDLRVNITYNETNDAPEGVSDTVTSELQRGYRAAPITANTSAPSAPASSSQLTRQVNYNIDARGAAPGVEKTIIEALKKVHAASVRDAVTIMSER